MSDELIKFEELDGIAIITMDDNKVNALSPPMIDALNDALDDAEASADAVVLAGREGRFSAGFDLKVMMSGPEQVRGLLVAGANLLLRLYELPKPVVVACTGHAIAAGALLIATGDARIGVRGPFRIGLNEVANSMPVPIFAHRLATDRLDPRALTQSVLHAHQYDPEGAVEAGWLDQVVDGEALRDVALTKAKELSKLPPFAFAATKESLRRESIAHIRRTLNDDIARFLG